MFYAAVFCFVVFFTRGLAQQQCTGVILGNLTEGVEGVLRLFDEYTLCIENFTFNGSCPDAFLYFSYPGYPLQNTGGGVIINMTTERSQFAEGVRFENTVLFINLPNLTFRACDFGGFSIWCRSACQLFTYLQWNTTVFSANGTSGTVQCVPSPGRGYVGSLPTQGHKVEGNLYIKDNKTFVIRNFRYDGTAPDTFVYWYSPNAEVTKSGGGQIIPILGGSEGKFGSTLYDSSYTDDFEITISNDVDVFTCDVGTLTIWCRQFSVFFTTISINLELFSNNRLEVEHEPNRIICDRATTRPGILVGELPTKTNAKAISGTFYVQDQWTFFIQLFSYDASKDNAVFYFYRTAVTPNPEGDGEIIPRSDIKNAFEKGVKFYKQDLTVNLRLTSPQIKACQISLITIYDQDAKEHITEIIIPKDIFTTDDTKASDKILCDSGAPRLVMTYMMAAVFAMLACSLSY